MTAHVVAYEIVRLADGTTERRIDVSEVAGTSNADRAFLGLCQKIDYDRFWLRTVYAPGTVECPDCGEPHDVEACAGESATCDCCAAIVATCSVSYNETTIRDDATIRIERRYRSGG